MEIWFDNVIYKLPNDDIVVIYRDLTEEKEKEIYIERLSYRDGLTDLYNRNFFKDKFSYFDSEEALPLTVIIGDISGLKIINDAFGHHVGDKAIIKTADILRDIAGENYIFRWGGDEFLAILPNTSEYKGRVIRNKINKTFEDVTADGIKVNISLGRSCKKTNKDNFDDILKEAEDKMYKNKLLSNTAQRSSILLTIKQTLFEKSNESEEHGKRLAKLTRKIGEEFDLSTDQHNDLEMLSSLHDIGMIAVDNSIIEKTEKLTKEEWELIKTHPEVGYRIASAIPELRDIAECILSHHERWDGKGYPRSLKKTEITLLARIFSVVDAYDAMTHDRPYKKKMTHEEALEEIKENSGTQFDPEVVEKFLKII